jgi:hypothetical protein
MMELQLIEIGCIVFGAWGAGVLTVVLIDKMKR